MSSSQDLKPTEGRTLPFLPSARSVDHIGITVPDLDAAVEFFVTYLGCHVVWRIGPFSDTGTGMHDRLNVHPRATNNIVMLRMGPTMNLELFEYDSPDQNRTAPRNSDIGGTHIGINVDDIDEAVTYLRSVPGVTVQSGPNHVRDDSDVSGLSWCYFTTPWGYQMEVVSAPSGLAYEQRRSARLAPPAPAWDAADEAP